MASHNNNILQPVLPKLNGKNYHHWSIQMKVLYESLDLWNIVENGIAESSSQTALTEKQFTELKENRKRDKRALFFIFQAVEEAIFERISASTTSKEAWDILYNTYRGEEKVKIVRLQTLRCEFDNIKMKESESVEDYYNRVILLLNQLRINGETIEDKRVVEKILRSLTRKFEYVVVAIEESKDISALSLESLIGTLQSHELRMRQFDDVPTEQAFQVLSKVKGKERVNDLDDDKEVSNHGEGTSKREEFSGRSRIPLSEKQCYYCHKYGHIMKFCKKKQQDEQEDAKFMKESKETMFMMVEDNKDCVNDYGDFKECDDMQDEKILHDFLRC